MLLGPWVNIIKLLINKDDSIVLDRVSYKEMFARLI